MQPQTGSGQPSAGTGGWKAVILLWAAGVCAAFQFAKVGVAFQPLAEVLDVGPEAVGALMGAAGTAGVVLGLAGAGLASRLGLGRVLLWALAIAAVLSLIEALMTAYPIFYVLRLLEGVTNLFIVIAAPSLIVQQAPRRHLAIALGLWSTFYGVAFALAAVMAWLLLDPFGPKSLLVVHAGLCLVVLALLRPLLRSGRQVLGRWQDVFAAFSPAAHAVAYSRPRIFLPGVVFLFHAAVYVGLIVFLPPLAPTAATVKVLAVSMPTAAFLGTLLSGFVVRGRSAASGRWLVAGFVFAFVQSLALGAGVPGWVFAAIGTLIALTMGVIQGLVFILVPYLAQGPDEEALGFGVIVQTGGLANMAGPPVFAALVAGDGRAGLMWGVAVCLGLGGVAAWSGLRRLRVRP
ncbi:MFS transporter [Tabrizicola sp.]|uniref:MFS transporter n=1 Tax=Tabrizicola sp. TaxID=2005166 RepID=UPI003F385EB3